MQTKPNMPAVRNRHPPLMQGSGGFTMIELIMVVVILGILAVFALPKFSDLTADARASRIESIAGAMRSTVSIVRGKATAQGLQRRSTWDSSLENDYLVTTEAGTFEVAQTNLCPESTTEKGDTISFAQSMGLSTNGKLLLIEDNFNVWVGFDLDGDGAVTDDLCFAHYHASCVVSSDISGCS